MLACAKGLGFRLEIADYVPRWVNSDPVRVRQILANFANNALKFTAKGLIDVRIASLPDGRLRIEVKDTGPGVPESLMPPALQALFAS